MSSCQGVLGRSESSARRDRGTVEMRWECARLDGTAVLQMVGIAYFARRPQEDT